MFSPRGMEYHERFMEEYGTAFEVFGLLGVSTRRYHRSSLQKQRLNHLSTLKDKQFFIADARAISVILNNTDTFYETKCVYLLSILLTRLHT